MGEAIDYALPGRRGWRRGWVIWVVGIVLGAGLIWFGPGAWREGVVWVTWRVAPWVQAGEGKVVWEKGGVVYENWAWRKWMETAPITWPNVLFGTSQPEADALVYDVKIGSENFRVLIGMKMTESVSGGLQTSVRLVDPSTSPPQLIGMQLEMRPSAKSGIGPRMQWIVIGPTGGKRDETPPLNGKVWAGRVDPGDPNRLLVDYELYGERETFEVRVTVDAQGKPVLKTKWLGGK